MVLFTAATCHAKPAPQFRSGGLDFGFPVPAAAFRRSWLRSLLRGVANGDRNTASSRTSTLRVRFWATTTTSTTGSSSGITITTRYPGFRINEVSALNLCGAKWSNGTFRPYVFRIGGHAELLSDVAAAIAGSPQVFGRDPGSDRHQNRAEYQTAGGQVALSFTVLHRYNHDACRPVMRWAREPFRA